MTVLTGPVAFAQVEEEINVDLMEIWVKVTDKNNNIVKDLTPNNFKIFIDGKQMQLRCFDTTFGSADQISQLSNADPTEERNLDSDSSSLKRKFIFYFDLLNSSAGDINFLKQKVGSFLNGSFGENDEGMVFVLLPNLKLGVVQKMTPNKEALISVVNRIKGNPTLEARLHNNEKELLEILYGPGTNTRFDASGTAEDARFSRSVESIQQAKGFAGTLASQEENLSQLTLNSFLSVAEHLSGNHFEGRIVMIYLSGGFSLQPGQIWYDIVDRAVEESALLGQEDLVIRSRPGYDLYGELTRTIGLLNRLNVTIYSIDSSGMEYVHRGGERTGAQITRGADYMAYTQELEDSLAEIAEETGGFALTDMQDYQKGLEEIAQDMNQQYWLCSNVPATKKKGQYHKIQVKVDRPDLKVRYRQGYVD
jgi:VWFA-related protein